MEELISLAEMEVGSKAIIKTISGHNAITRRLRDMGLIPNATVSCEHKAPLGDPIDILIKGSHLTLRKSEAEAVKVQII